MKLWVFGGTTGGECTETTPTKTTPNTSNKVTHHCVSTNTIDTINTTQQTTTMRRRQSINTGNRGNWLTGLRRMLNRARITLKKEKRTFTRLQCMRQRRERLVYSLQLTSLTTSRKKASILVSK